MYRIFFPIVIVLALLGHGTPLQTAEVYPFRLPGPVLDRTSAEIGTDVRTFRLDPVQMNLSSGYSLLPFHQLLFQDPLMSAETMSRITSFLTKTPVNFYSFIANGSILIDRRVGSVNPPVWGEDQPTINDFQTILQSLEDQMTRPPESEWKESVEPFYRAVPPSIQSVVYRFLRQVSQSHPRMQTGRAALEANDSYRKILEELRNDDGSVSFHHLLDTLYGQTDLVSIFHSSSEMGYWLNTFIDNKSSIDPASIQDRAILQTPLGAIIVSGASDDTHDYETPPMLLLDCGGNDTYRGAYSKTDDTHPFSLTIDLGGEDAYASQTEPLGAGTGFFGCAALVDLGPEPDRYTGKSRCFGYAFGGVSLVYDEGGDTIYEIESTGLSASEMGIAVFIDGAGNDTYFAFKESQGYGCLGGFSVLYDIQGCDHYIAPATPVVSASAQLSDRNYSGSQGFGRGWFGPNDRGLSFWGGVGMLIDRQGDDVYEASVFAQGSGYGYGAGCLADLDGNDFYRAEWYAMGTGAHQGSGFLIDSGGDDSYLATHYMIGGCANDLSLGSFWDDAGADRYSARNASFGYGLTNSYALFVDREGDDQYAITDHHGLGHALNDRQETLRGLWPTFALFFDLAGRDAYPEPITDNDKIWIRESREDKPYLFMLGMDAANALSVSYPDE